MSPLQAILTAETEEARPSMWPERLSTLFDAHRTRLYRLARRMSRDAEASRDLVQETFLRAARSPKSVPRDDGQAEAWLVRVMVNLCRDRQRRAVVRQRPWPTDPSPAEAPDPEAAAVARTTVQAALAQLAPRRRAIVVLRELEDVPVAGIAELLGIAKVTVRWHLKAARRELAEILLSERGGPQS